MQTREDCIHQIKNTLPQNPVTCEIGFFRGEFSKIINAILNPSKHYSVDLFQGMTVSGDKDGNDIQYQEMSEMKLYSESLGYHTIAGTSDNLLDLEEMFDFIYIDADHSYEWVKKDLTNAYKKIKPGGIIGGHDYSCTLFRGCFDAVNDFCKENNLKINILSQDGCPSYFIHIDSV